MSVTDHTICSIVAIPTMSVTDHTICSIVAIPTEYALSLQAEGSKMVVTSLDCSSLSPPF